MAITFHIITLFPESLDSYFDTSVIKRAKVKKKINIKFYDLKKFTRDRHGKVDDRPYGGGAGMVLSAEPIIRAVTKIKKSVPKKSKMIILSAKGKQFDQGTAYKWSKKLTDIILIAGRYEGIDERVKKIFKAEEISIGPYVLTDGESAAMVVVSTITRLVPGVIKFESLVEESHWDTLLKEEKGLSSAEGLEYPHYTRPEVIKYGGKSFKVPKVLLSGNHQEIKKWRSGERKGRG